MLVTSNPPYAVITVGLEPSSFIAFGCTTKYGTFVPSFDVAWRCSTVSRDASNCARRVLAMAIDAVCASASHTLLGVRNPATFKSASVPFRFTSAIETARLSGSGNGARVHVPLAARVKTNARPRTFSYTVATSRSRVAEAPSTDSAWSGLEHGHRRQVRRSGGGPRDVERRERARRMCVAPSFHASDSFTIIWPSTIAAGRDLRGKASLVTPDVPTP